VVRAGDESQPVDHKMLRSGESGNITLDFAPQSDRYREWG